jgi:hypothetical protein
MSSSGFPPNTTRDGIISVERWRVEFLDDRHERAIMVPDSVGYEVLEYQTYYYPTDMLRDLSRLALGQDDQARRAVEVYGPDRDSLDGPVYVWELAATLGLLGFHGASIDQLVVHYGNLGPWSPSGLERHPHFRHVAEDVRWSEVEAAAAAWDERMERAGLR